jgi:hypothetical protein
MFRKVFLLPSPDLLPISLIGKPRILRAGTEYPGLS